MFSFSMRLFLGFWFIALTAIFGTRYISMKLLDDNFTTALIEKTNTNDIRQLQRLAQRLKHRSHIPISAFLKKNKTSHRGDNIWLKADKINAPVQNSFPLPTKQQENISTYINSLYLQNLNKDNFPILNKIKINQLKLNIENEFNLFSKIFFFICTERTLTNIELLILNFPFVIT